ncbi:hypothetical protein HID58_039178, partial [Brassica napus]
DFVLMEENPHRVSRKHNGGTHCQNDAVYEESLKCSGKRCRSWAAAAIADCVALCCCPCAIINFLTLTFVKVPWTIGRRCLGRSRNKKKKKRKLHMRQDRGKFICEDVFEMAGGDEKCGGGVGCCGGGDYDDHRGDDESRISARVEAERVWLELYQIGHLGFGRVSFTGIQ